MIQNEIEKGLDMKRELIQKYEKILPEELIKIWKDYGMSTLLKGYLKIINPEEYQELLNETYFRGTLSIPILTTAFGDVITLEEGHYISMVKYKNGSFIMLAKNFKRFIQNLTDDFFFGKIFSDFSIC